MASTNRTGRVSAIDYEAGTYEVTYFDRGQSVTRKINAISNGEYKMPVIGQIVSVAHTSSGLAAATTTGTVWNKTNRPAEGFKGLYRKEYGSQKGRAYIDADFIIKAASLLSALGALVAAVVAVYKVLENNKKQNEFINAMQEEQTLICYGLRGALQGLVEQGCNGPCKDALARLDKHLNKSAHPHIPEG